VRGDGRPWPRIAITTPSYNQGQFIEETIRSILLQGYPNLGYVVIDGGSSDNTKEVLRRYDRYIDFWTSERDKGQADAINKGFAKSTGEILAWLNSDDVYEMGVLTEVAELFLRQPDTDVISGRCRLWYGDTRDFLFEPSPLRSLEDFLMIGSNWLKGKIIVQPEAFFRQRAFEKANGLCDHLYYCFDVALWMDMARAGCKFDSVDRRWANLRKHDGQKTRDLTNVHMEVARVAHDRLLANWERVENPLAIANDIFGAVEALLKNEQETSKRYSESTSYRLGRAITKLRFW
jgi:glycosyltransferase involved in cell wall biosynthesis